MTTDLQIERVLKNIPNFGGVYLYNQLENINKLSNQVIVINYVTEEESHAGKEGHFVVLDNRNILKADNKNHMYFFDPYGFPPDEPRDIMKLPNTKNITNLIKRTNVIWDYNNFDYQAWAKWDDLCGVYSSEYVVNPNFNTNPLFRQDTGSRVAIDKKLLKIYDSLGFVNHPFKKYTAPQLNTIRLKLKNI